MIVSGKQSLGLTGRVEAHYEALVSSGAVMAVLRPLFKPHCMAPGLS
jgi:hypothetical protein